MDRSQPKSSAGGDRLSKLEDRVLGNILSYLPAKEAARAALLSSRWRHAFAAVHTISIEEPEGPIPSGDNRGCDSPECRTPQDPNAPPPFSSAVSAAIIARQRRRGAAPLRALRVAKGGYVGGDSSTLDQWVSYAVQQAAPEGLHLALALRLPCDGSCQHPYVLRRGKMPEPDMMVERSTNIRSKSMGDDVGSESNYDPWQQVGDPWLRGPNSTADAGSESDNDAGSEFDDDDGSVVSSDHDERVHRGEPWWMRPRPEYTVPRALFTCAELRSLTLSSCRVAPPAATAVSLPSLVTLLLSDVPDAGADVERLVAGCPRLADLELEACGAVTSLTVQRCLRRLALRCCHQLATVVVDSSELQAFEYRGAVTDPASFLTLHSGAGRIAYCKLDICGAEATSEAELTNLRHFLRLFANAKHLHLESARLGSGFDKDVPARLADFPNLRRLEMRGCPPPDDDTGHAIAAVSRVLEHAPNLEALSLAFHPDGEHYLGCRSEYIVFSEGELADAHHLDYNSHSVLATPGAMIPCLGSTVREINLVHYQGGMAQRALAKFLLRNAPAVDKLWCEFAEGPMWAQVQLMRELKVWLINKSADTHFA